MRLECPAVRQCRNRRPGGVWTHRRVGPSARAAAARDANQSPDTKARGCELRAAGAAAAAADKSSTTGAAPVNHQSLMGVTSSNSSAKVSVCAYILHVHVVLFLNACSNCIVPYCLQFSLSRIRFLYTPCTIIVSLNLSGRKNFRATHTVTLT